MSTLQAPTLLNAPLVICVNPQMVLVHVSTVNSENTILEFQLRKKYVLGVCIEWISLLQHIWICKLNLCYTHFCSKKMVGMWTCGDCFKTGYFIVRQAPAQFWICGMLQVGIDISIFLQVYCYRNKAAISWPRGRARIYKWKEFFVHYWIRCFAFNCLKPCLFYLGLY